MEVIILGDGPAGLAAAIVLRQSGYPVTVAGRRDKPKPAGAGESLAPSALTSLRQLGLEDHFLADGHAPCLGNCSSWGSPELHFFDYLQSPGGGGWYLDRPKFNAMLKEAALASGARFVETTSAATLQKVEEGFRLDLGARLPGLPGHFVLDCTGRSSWLGRQFRTGRQVHDRQVALAGLIRTGKPQGYAFHSLIEAVEDGWWYVAPAGAGTAVCIFFTDADLHNMGRLSSPAAWAAKKSETRFVRLRVPDGGELPEMLYCSSAGSSMLNRLSGRGWAAAGDAACSLDPVSAHGLAFALASGMDAGKAVASYLGGQTGALAAYEWKITGASTLYLQERFRIYSMEQRWPLRPYWRRRHAATFAGASRESLDAM